MPTGPAIPRTASSKDRRSTAPAISLSSIFSLVAHAWLGHVFVFAPNGEMIACIESCAGHACTNVAIGGENRDRLYITESTSGSVLVADLGELK
jgi:hypothetical protein